MFVYPGLRAVNLNVPKILFYASDFFVIIFNFSETYSAGFVEYVEASLQELVTLFHVWG
jgi:hypothetical protein